MQPTKTLSKLWQDGMHLSPFPHAPVFLPYAVPSREGPELTDFQMCVVSCCELMRIPWR